ncbi:MAG: hypothetical protein B7Z30_08020 [Rhizobiales bacterium 12-68-15]|nr:MAG: hypothetical protein B7Z30_08020 [Rhizobiales bacterium 12-68-15]
MDTRSGSKADPELRRDASNHSGVTTSSTVRTCRPAWITVRQGRRSLSEAIHTSFGRKPASTPCVWEVASPSRTTESVLAGKLSLSNTKGVSMARSRDSRNSPASTSTETERDAASASGCNGLSTSARRSASDVW